jgi:membrane protein
VPVALVALAAMGLFGAESLYTAHIAHTLQSALSPDAYAIANRTATKAMSSHRGWWLTIGLAVMLYGVGAALRSMMSPLNAVYGSAETRSWKRRFAISIGAGALVTALVGAAIVIVLGGRLVHAHGIVSVLLFLGRWAAAFLLLLGANAALIRFVPAKARPLHWVSLGSALSVICWAVASAGFAAYVSAVPYASFYGALATIVLLLMYFHVAAIAFLLGVVVDSAVRDEVRATKKGRPKRGRRRTPAGR